MSTHAPSSRTASFIAIGPLSGTDQLSLLKEVGENSLTFENRPIGGAKAGEPVTIAIIVLSQIAITGLAAYLLKTTKSKKVKISYIKFETPHVSLELRDFEFEANSEEEPKAALIRALKGSLSELIDAKGSE